MAGDVPFEDRYEAGRLLGQRLARAGLAGDLVVLALPRGGVPVGHEVARELGAPLDTFVVRKLGVPGHEELAMGAIASGGRRVLNMDVVRELGISEAEIERVAVDEAAELRRRERAYRDGLPPTPIEARHIVLVDDGLATGASMRAAIEAVRLARPREITVAVPVAAAQTCKELAPLVDRIICLETPGPLYGVGLWYHDFAPTTDDEVRRLLQSARSRADTPAPNLRP